MNYVDFYKQWGLDGHNGVDYACRIGTPLYACHGGEVIAAKTDRDGGVMIEIISSRVGEGYKTIYYHLKDYIVQKGDTVIAGQLIGYTGNTGKYTTGPHLHLGFKFVIDGRTQNYSNGYKGAIDPTPYFPKNYEKSRAYHRYGKKRNWLAEYWMRFAPIEIKNRWADGGRYLHNVMLRMGYTLPTLSGEQVNAVIYGAWDAASVLNPAMAQSWRWYTKDEFQKIIK
jgi:hypothetical protein